MTLHNINNVINVNALIVQIHMLDRRYFKQHKM